MFESCSDLASLNEERILAIRSGVPSVRVNKEYARRKAEVLSNQSVGVKRVPFFPAPVKELQQIISIDATWLAEDPYTLIINESV